MDFQSLTRKELQALCKKNKIPANTTNASMADALQNLVTVEGLEDILNQSQIEAPGSPGDFKTGSLEIPESTTRTSTRRKPVKEEPQSVQTGTRTRRAPRRDINEEMNQLNESAKVPVTPGVPTTRRKATAQKSRTQLKRDEDREKLLGQEDSNDIKTPAAEKSRRTPAVSTRKKVEETLPERSVQRAYSTRRSVRLLENCMTNLSLKEKETEKPDEIVESSKEASVCEEKALDSHTTSGNDSEINIGLEQFPGKNLGETLEREKDMEVDIKMDAQPEDEKLEENTDCFELNESPQKELKLTEDDKSDMEQDCMMNAQTEDQKLEEKTDDFELNESPRNELELKEGGKMEEGIGNDTTNDSKTEVVLGRELDKEPDMDDAFGNKNESNKLDDISDLSHFVKTDEPEVNVVEGLREKVVEVKYTSQLMKTDEREVNVLENIMEKAEDIDFVDRKDQNVNPDDQCEKIQDVETSTEITTGDQMDDEANMAIERYDESIEHSLGGDIGAGDQVDDETSTEITTGDEMEDGSSSEITSDDTESDNKADICIAIDEVVAPSKTEATENDTDGDIEAEDQMYDDNSSEITTGDDVYDERSSEISTVDTEGEKEADECVAIDVATNELGMGNDIGTEDQMYDESSPEITTGDTEFENKANQCSIDEVILNKKEPVESVKHMTPSRVSPKQSPRVEKNFISEQFPRPTLSAVKSSTTEPSAIQNLTNVADEMNKENLDNIEKEVEQPKITNKTKKKKTIDEDSLKMSSLRQLTKMVKNMEINTKRKKDDKLADKDCEA